MLETIFMLAFKMISASLENLTKEELMNLSENMSRQQLKSIITIPSAPKPTPKYTPLDEIENKKINRIDNRKKKIDRLKNYKSKKVADAFDDNFTEVKSKAYIKLLMIQHFYEIRSYLHDMIDNLRAFGKWKIQLTAKRVFILLKDCSRSEPMHSKSSSIEIMIGVDI